MKAKRGISRGVITSLVMVGMLVLVGMIAFVSRGGQGAPLVDNGPNAGLSNEQLVRQAVANMAALKSYHLEFEGVTTSTKSGNPSLTMAYDQNGRATVGTLIYNGAGDSADKSLLNMDSSLHPGSAPLRIDMNIAIASEKETQGGWWYESYDGGKTWEAGFGGWGPSIMGLGAFGGIRNSAGNPGGYLYMLPYLSGLKFEDASPRLEEVDQTLTRHIKTEIPKTDASMKNAASLIQALGGSHVELWVSTDVTPTIRRMAIEGYTEQIVEKTSLTAVQGLEFSPDGKTLAVAHDGIDGEGMVRLWDLTSPGSNPRILELRLANDGPNSIAFRPDSIAYSPDGKWLAASAWVYGEPKPTGRVYLWDLSGQTPTPIILTTPEVAEVADLVFDPGGRLLAFMAGVYSWDIPVTSTEGMLVHSTGRGRDDSYAFPSAAAFSPDGSMLAVSGIVERPADWDSRKRVWLFDVEHPDVPAVTHSTGDEVATRVKFSPDGKLLVSNGDYRVRVWDLVRPEQEPIVLPGEWVYAGIAFSPDGKYLAVTGGENQVRVYETATISSQRASTPAVMMLPVEGTIFSLAYSPDGKLLVAGDLDGRVSIFQTADLTVDGTSKAEPTLLVEKGAGDTQVIRGPTCSLTWQWSRLNEDFGEIKPPVESGDDGGATSPYIEPTPTAAIGGSSSVDPPYVYSVAFSPDGKILASGAGDGTIKLWDVADGREIRTLLGNSERVYSVAFSPDGRTLASGHGDHTLRLWDLQTGKEIHTISAHDFEVTTVAFSPDGRTVASGAGLFIKLWDVNTGKEIRTLSGHYGAIYSVAFSPDGKTLASGSNDNFVMMWDIKSGKQTQSIHDHSDLVLSVAFSPDGKTLASGSWDRTIKLRDAATGKEIRTLPEVGILLNSIAFSPDSKTLASGSSDGTIKLWDVNAGTEIRTLAAHTEAVSSVAFSPDGLTLASGSEDLTAKLWNVADGQEVRSLAATGPR